MTNKISAKESISLRTKGPYKLCPPASNKYCYKQSESMENGDSSGSSDASLWQSLRIPPFRDPILPCSTSNFSCQITDITQHFSSEVAHKLAARGTVKAVQDVSHLLCKYHFLLLRLGTTQDGEDLRAELAKIQQSSCDIVTTVRVQLSNAFRRTDSLPKKDIINLEKSCRILVACIHMLDRQLRRTLHLYRLFPLIPDPDGIKECHFINTGLSECFYKCPPPPLLCRSYDVAERYIREKDSWQELEKEILEVHNLDVDLHRDEVLGPILDYLTLCPLIAGLDDISSSTVSVSDMCVAPENCTDDISRKKSSLACYIVAIAAVVCVGGGVLLGVILMIVY